MCSIILIGMTIGYLNDKLANRCVEVSDEFKEFFKKLSNYFDNLKATNPSFFSVPQKFTLPSGSGILKTYIKIDERGNIDISGQYGSLLIRKNNDLFASNKYTYYKLEDLRNYVLNNFHKFNSIILSRIESEAQNKQSHELFEQLTHPNSYYHL